MKLNFNFGLKFKFISYLNSLFKKLKLNCSKLIII